MSMTEEQIVKQIKNLGVSNGLSKSMAKKVLNDRLNDGKYQAMYDQERRGNGTVLASLSCDTQNMVERYAPDNFPVIQPEKNGENLSRAERRRMEREQAKKNKGLNISPLELQQMVEKAKVDYLNENRDKIIRTVTEDIVNEFMIQVIYVLSEKFGFGQKRISRFIHAREDLAECVTRHYVNQQDLVDLLAEKSIFMNTKLKSYDVNEDCLSEQEYYELGKTQKY